MPDRTPQRRKNLRLRSWPLRSKVAAVLAAPVAALVVVASIAVADKAGAASEGAEVGQLADSTTLVATLVNDLQKERSLAGGLLNDASSAAGKSQFDLQNDLTDKASRDLAEAVAVDAEGSAARFKDTVNEAVAPLSGLPQLRAQVLEGTSAEDSLAIYTDAISGLLDANSQVATLADDDRLSQQVRSYVALSRYKEQIAQQVALLYDVFTQGEWEGNQYTEAVLLVGFLTELGEVGVDVVFKVLVQFLAAQVFEILPAQQLAFWAIGKQAVKVFAAFFLLLKSIRFALCNVFLHIQHTGEQQVADLFDNG